MPTSTQTGPDAAAAPRGTSRLANKIALNSSVQASRQLLVAVFGIVSVGVATRYLSVDDYGGVIAALALVSLFSVASDFGIGAMAVRAMAREPENDVAIASSAFWVWVAFAIPTGLVIFAISRFAYAGPEHAVARHAVLILVFTLLFGPFGGVAAVRAMTDQRMWLTSVGSICARAVSLVATVLAALLKLGPMGIAAGLASGFVLENLFSVLLVRPHFNLRLGLDRTRIHSLVVAALPLGTIAVINGLYFKLDAFMLAVLGSSRDVAIYGVAYKAFDTLLSFPGLVMITLLPELARLLPDEPRSRQLVQKAFTGMCLISTPLIGLSVLGGPAIVALGGSRYAEGGIVVTMMIIAVAFSCLQGVFGNSLVAQGRQRVLLKVSASVLVVNGVLNLIAIPLMGVRGAAVVLVVSEILSLFMTMRIQRSLAPLPRVPTPGKLAIALIVMVAVMSIRFVIPGAIVGMLVAAVAGGTAYVGALLALRAIPSYILGPAYAVAHALRSRGTR